MTSFLHANVGDFDAAHVPFSASSAPPAIYTYVYNIKNIIKEFDSVHCGLTSSDARLLPNSIQGETLFTISLLSNVLPFTMWFNVSRCT